MHYRSILKRLRFNQVFFIQCRFKNYHKELKKKTNTEYALEHFDMFYRPVYGDLWPSIRISLLTTQKYCAVVNSFTSFEKTELKLSQLGATNIINAAIQKFEQNHSQMQENYNLRESVLKDMTSIDEADTSDSETADTSDEELISDRKDEDEDYLPPNVDKNTSLYDFVPAKKVYTSKESYERQEVDASVFRSSDFQVPVIPCVLDSVSCSFLKVYTYIPGSVKTFPSPKKGKDGYLDCYLMDAASILPVVALDLQMNDSVLDLCSAPGGKMLAILQTLLTDDVTCNDNSHSRLQRLKSIIQSYVDDDTAGMIKILDRDGRAIKDQVFDKVLVDVPCNTDRHVLSEDDNNLFQPRRSTERLGLPQLQKELLLAGIRSCKPEGTVVYSTCTLSPAQNDGVIQSTLEQIWRETKINLVVENLSYIKDIFSDTFKFYDRCRYGQLVIPQLKYNFGPMYFCKIKRLN